MLTIKGPRDINGNRREFYVFQEMTVPDEAIHVTPAEYRRLACRFGIDLDDEDTEIVNKWGVEDEDE